MEQASEQHILTDIYKQLGDAVIIVRDDEAIIDWVKKHVPLSITGIIEWSGIASAKAISLSYNDNTVLQWAFESLIQHVDAHEEDQVFVFWHLATQPTLSMSVQSCLKVLDQLLHLGHETYFASPDNGWFLEFDPYFDEAHGAKFPELYK